MRTGENPRKNSERCPYCSEGRHFHTKKWYMAEKKINPERTGVEPLLLPNPHYRSAPKMKLWAECQIEQAMKDHPELIIKPRTRKQSETIDILVHMGEDQKKILWMIEDRDSLRNHVEYHLDEGPHYHTEEDIEKMIREAEEMDSVIGEECKKFRKKWGRDPWLLK